MHSPTAKLRILALIVFAAFIRLAGPARADRLGNVKAPLELAQRFFPNADRCQPQARVINRQRVEEITELLPRTVSYNELGTRVVYSVFRGEKPLGLLHVRNEAGQWGLVEIAWALNTDLTIRDFAILRSREPERTLVETPAFRDSLRGQTYSAITARLIENEVCEPRRRDEPQADVTRIVLCSAIKCLISTQAAWELTALKLRIAEAAYAHFPEAASLRFAPQVRSRTLLTELEAHGLGPISPALRGSFIIAQAVDKTGAIIGSMVHMTSLQSDLEKTFLFTVHNGRVIHADILQVESCESQVAQLAELRGRTSAELAELATPIARLAAIAVVISNQEEPSNDDL